MFEKYEKFWVLAIIAVVIYFLYKKQKTSGGSCAQQATDSSSSFLETPLEHIQSLIGQGSIVNPTLEPKTVQPAQSTAPVLFRPAQPSTVPVSTRVSAGSYQWTPQRSPLRSVIA